MSSENVIVKIVQRSDGDLSVLIKTELGTSPINVLHALNKAQGEVLSRLMGAKRSSEWREAGSSRERSSFTEEEGVGVAVGFGELLCFLSMLERKTKEANEKNRDTSDKSAANPDKESGQKPETESKAEDLNPVNQ